MYFVAIKFSSIASLKLDLQLKNLKATLEVMLNRISMKQIPSQNGLLMSMLALVR